MVLFLAKEAMYWIKKDNDIVKCFLCPHGCVISPGNKGICRVRLNEKGILKAINYGLCTAIALDPIEKKPLYDFYPGSQILSIGTFGCNLKCSFCQNWQIAHGENPPNHELDMRDLVRLAQKYLPEGNIGVAYTYSEPLMWYEFVLDASKEIKETGLKNILVTNGYIEEEPLKELVPFIDAANVDVKAFNNNFYPKLCKGKLDPVKRTVEILAENIHVEITTLVIPGENDATDEIEELARWMKSISPEISLHLTRYFPNYNLNLPPTPLESLRRAKEVAEKYLTKVYLGNI
ncbi:MAG: pyruvate formate lyase activating enzyme [Clostridia bacterium]|nr:pyruvate formate lyase activating enzyme [Clostridia bacterium]MDN5323209.1 pyruvate formate lyase activating enzyme [Clostridia bacterium]